MRRDDHEQDVRDHDRPEHRADLQVRRPRRRTALSAPHAASATSATPTTASADLAPLADRPAEHVVDEPREREAADESAIACHVVEVGHRRIDEPHVRVEVVEDDEQREAREPRRVRLPLEPVERLGHLAPARGGTSASGRGRRRGRPRTRRRRPPPRRSRLRRPQRQVEPDEVEGRADPRDPRDDVEHPEADVEDVSQVRVHRSLAIATSSRQPVSSSSSRVRARRSRSTWRISRFGRPVDEDDEAEAELLLVDLVQVRELGEDGRVGVGALLLRRAPESRFAPIAGCALSASSFSSSLSVRAPRRACPSGILDLGQPLDERRLRPRRARRAARRSAAAVGRASERRDEQRDVVVAVARARSRARPA